MVRRAEAVARNGDSPRRVDPRPPDDAVVWVVRGCDGVSMLRAQYVRQCFPRHTHETFVIGVNERGAHATWHRGARHVIPARKIAIVAPGEVHTGEPVRGQPWHYCAIYVTPQLLEEVASAEDGVPNRAPTFRQLTIDDTALAARFLRMHRRSENSSSDLAMQSALSNLLSLLLGRHASTGPVARAVGSEPLAVRRVVEYLHEHLADAVSLGDLATAAGLSRYHLIRMFSRTRGLTPYAYLIQIRIEEAKRLIRHGHAPAAAAQVTGFSDQSHLTRAFHRLTGMTPGRYAHITRS